MHGPTLAEKASKAPCQVLWGTRCYASTRHIAWQLRTAQPAGLSFVSLCHDPRTGLPAAQQRSRSAGLLRLHLTSIHSVRWIPQNPEAKGRNDICSRETCHQA